MFKNYFLKTQLKRKLESLVEQVIKQESDITWKEELQAAKAIEIYVNLVKELEND